MNNPLHILKTLDKHLSRATELTIFGRAALALGFPNTREEFHSTQDVDGILPLSWLAAADENLDFWEAQQRANQELKTSHLYVTHLFRETEVILRPVWLSQRVELPLALRHLKVFRPAVVDLVLTKMARGDDDDLKDIDFLLRQESLSVGALLEAFSQASVPPLEEIRALFQAAQPKVLHLAGRIHSAQPSN